MQIVKIRYSGGSVVNIHKEVIECTITELKREVPFKNLPGKKHIETTISEKDWLVVTTKLEKIIQDWQPSYINDSIQDGFSWKLTITTTTNKYVYEGINAYPKNFKNFKKFDKLLDTLRSLV